MARRKMSILTDLSTGELKRLLAARERIDVLEAKKNKLAKELSRVEKELDALMTGKASGTTTRGRKKVRGRKSTSRVKLEDVVLAVLKKKGQPLAFKDLYEAIVGGKLFASKSKNFDNVLRRTLSTSKLVKRVGRGIYDVA